MIIVEVEREHEFTGPMLDVNILVNSANIGKVAPGSTSVFKVGVSGDLTFTFFHRGYPKVCEFTASGIKDGQKLSFKVELGFRGPTVKFNEETYSASTEFSDMKTSTGGAALTFATKIDEDTTAVCCTIQ